MVQEDAEQRRGNESQSDPDADDVDSGDSVVEIPPLFSYIPRQSWYLDLSIPAMVAVSPIGDAEETT